MSFAFPFKKNVIRHEAMGVVKFANGLVAVRCPDVIGENTDRACAGAEVKVHRSRNLRRSLTQRWSSSRKYVFLRKAQHSLIRALRSTRIVNSSSRVSWVFMSLKSAQGSNLRLGEVRQRWLSRLRMLKQIDPHSLLSSEPIDRIPACHWRDNRLA